jgi:hypothetical protein
MNYLLNLFLIGDRFVRLAGIRPDGIQVVELLSRGGVYSTVGMHPNHRTWSTVPA